MRGSRRWLVPVQALLWAVAVFTTVALIRVAVEYRFRPASPEPPEAYVFENGQWHRLDAPPQRGL